MIGGSERYGHCNNGFLWKSKSLKITNWSAYNNALRLRGSLTVWLDESAIAAWTYCAQSEGCGRALHYTNMAITTVLMMKRVFNLP